MVALVPAAFFATGLANLGAQLAQRLGEITAASLAGGGHATDGGAVHVERNAARHHLHVRLLETRRRAVVAGIGAPIAGVDAGRVLLVGHVETPGGWSLMGGQSIFRLKAVGRALSKSH